MSALPRRARHPRPKKQRGWARRLRALDAWAAAQPPPAPREGPEYASAELWFGAWPRPLPARVRRRAVQHLVAIHDAWAAALAGTPGPHYLGLWLFGADLEESQVVAAWGERAADYSARHPPAGRTAPPATFHRRPRDLAHLEWTREVEVWREPLSELAADEVPRALRDAAAVEGEGARAVARFEREVWRARLPAPPTPAAVGDTPPPHP